MNPVAWINALSAIVIAAVALPLIRGAVKMNDVYGIRIPQAFASEERWYAINRHGGRLVLRWALTILAYSIGGLFLPRPWWLAYNLTAIVVVLGGLAWTIWLILRFARSLSKDSPDPTP